MKRRSRFDRARDKLLIAAVGAINDRLASEMMINTLRRGGAKIIGKPRYISARSYFDGLDYSLIEIGHACTISFFCRILTHDWSPDTVSWALDMRHDPPLGRVETVSIGDFAFVGAGSILLPGARIGKGAVVGAGSVVRGAVPDFSIITGNPAQVVGDSRDLVQRAVARREVSFDKHRS